MRPSLILILHACAGMVGLLSGAVAMAVRKGSRIHGKAGVVFSMSMLTLAVSGVYLAVMKSQTGNILGGILTFYMVGTAWLTARRNKQTGIADWFGLAVALTVGISCLVYGSRVANGLIHPRDGVPAGMDFFLGGVLLIAAAGDMRVLVQGGISGAQRMARHLWRMCFALFIASGSFFMGRQQIFPTFDRRSNGLVLLTILPLLLLFFWLARVRFTDMYKRKLMSAQPIRALPLVD